jgi:hypothetical protein
MKWKLVHGATLGSRNKSGMESLAFLTVDDDVVTQGQRTRKHEPPSSKTYVHIISKCPYIITPTVMARVQELHDF